MHHALIYQHFKASYISIPFVLASEVIGFLKEMALNVYGMPMSTKVARVLVFLEEVGAQYELVPIKFSSGEHKSMEHSALNVSYFELSFVNILPILSRYYILFLVQFFASHVLGHF